MTHTTTSSGRRLLGTNTREASFSPLVKPKVPIYLDQNLSHLEQTPSLPTPLYTNLLRPQAPSSPPPKLAIPSCWNPKDKSQFLDISESNTRISYQGPGKSDMDAATVRANHPIPHQCGIFYFEIEIISKGRDGYIAIGFTGPHVSLGRLPGWDDMSWGYHGDDGNSFACSGTGKAYGPTFTTGDVIGCIINLSDYSASFTKNGLLLGTAFKDFSKDVKDKKQNVAVIYPAIGLRTPGEVIQVNFGQKPFKFDIEQYFKEERIRFWNQVIFTQKETMDISSLILSHLVHSGYHESALKYFQSIRSSHDSFDSLPGSSTIQIRKQLRLLLLQGNIQETLDVIQVHFSHLFEKYPVLHFALSVQKFIEMIRSQLDSMDVEGQREGKSQESLLQVIRYGQEIQSQFESILQESKIQEALNQVFSLLCYENPENSMVSFLLDKRNRSVVADALNSSILEIESCLLQESPLEKLYKQSVTVHKELLESNVGSAAFIHIERDCFC